MISSPLRTRPILQMEAAECGAASLAIVFAYHHLFVSLERLRDECGVSRDGTNAARIAAVARRYGFITKGLRKGPEELAAVPAPAILHWNFDHFVVLEEVGKKKAWINDPARGRREISPAELARKFSGFVLVFVPGPEFLPIGAPPRVVPVLLEWLAPWRSSVATLLLMSLLLVIPGWVVPLISRKFVDQVLIAGRSHWVTPLLIGMLGAALLRGVLTWTQRSALLKLSRRLIAEIAGKYLKQAMELPYSFFLARHPGDVAARVEISDRLSWLLAGDLPALALSSLKVVFYLGSMAYLEPSLAGMALIFALIALAVDRAGARLRAEKAEQLLHQEARLLGLSAGGLQAIETLKASGAESGFMKKWLEQQAQVRDARQAWALTSEGFAVATKLFHSVGVTGVLGVAATRVMDGKMSPGTWVAFQSLMASFLVPLGELARFLSQVDEIRPQVARFRDVLDHPAQLSPLPSASTSSMPEGAVEFRNVSFGYDRMRPPILKNFSFYAAPRSRIAIVGRTGSGKSTLARLMSGLFSPWSGEVLVPRASIATVEQEIHLFEGTIAENLRLWDPSISDEALKRAIRDACAEDWIARLPRGIDTRLCEGGRNLSGGERSRLEIARALVRDPSVLVLDEATSALDPEMESRIYERLRRRGCTCVLIAHRLSAIRESDEILVLDRGETIQRGTHEELWKKGGLYRELILTEGDQDDSER